MRQQILPLKLIKAKTFSNFFGKTNQGLIKNLQTLTSTSVLYLWGKPSLGCSHLLQATCHYWQQKGWHAVYLDLKQPDLLESFFRGALEGLQLLAIDHLECAIGNAKLEENLFHLFNRALQTPFALIWGAHQAPSAMTGNLADFSSRLNASLVFQIKTPTDTEIQRILKEYAKQQGLELNDNLLHYLLTHHSRELKALFVLVDKLDQASLRAQKKLTIPLLKKFCELSNSQ